MADVRTFGPLTVRELIVKGKPTGKWLLDIPATLTGNGKRNRVRYATVKDAEAAAKMLKRGLELRKLGFVEIMPKTGVMFSEAVEQWVAEMDLEVRSLKLRPASMRTIRTRLAPLLAFFGSNSVRSITTDRIREYQVRRVELPRNPSTVNGEVRILRQFLGWACMKGEVDRVPVVKRIPETPKEPDLPTMADVVALLRHLPLRDHMLVRLMAETGLRPSEALNLPWEHVDLAKLVIVIKAYDGWQPKTRHSGRVRPISSHLRSGLTKLWLENKRRNQTTRWVFPGRDPTKPLRNIRKALETAVRKAGITRNGRPLHLTVKTFRKAYTSWLVARDVHHRKIQYALGHAPGSRVTDMHYAYVTDEMGVDTAIALPSRAVRRLRAVNDVAVLGTADT